MLGFKRYGIKSDALFWHGTESAGLTNTHYMRRWARPRRFGKCFLVAVALLYVVTMYMFGNIIMQEMNSSPEDVSNSTRVNTVGMPP